MKYFEVEFLKFYEELERNNNREWFLENKKRYEKYVKKPFLHFTDDLILELTKLEPEINMSAQEAVFRINRDIRFSADKTPYKTQSSAIVSKYGKKDKGSMLGTYFEMSHKNLTIYGGSYLIDKEHLESVRSRIGSEPDEFNKAINFPAFKKFYGEIQGEKNKRISPEFKEVIDKQPLILNKQFYYSSSLPAETILSDDLLKVFTEYFEAQIPIYEFLKGCF